MFTVARAIRSVRERPLIMSDFRRGGRGREGGLRLPPKIGH